ncbi:unnamed protein product [Clonostachys byssicola]|uniref:Uncharacterized protein n=1 Tax=Clonostachys byssicola TaxID=160290 RepID=A0A9N9UDK7_9HYPO|nr:unnamed protein product [Clonostachys byssicola]
MNSASVIQIIEYGRRYILQAWSPTDVSENIAKILIDTLATASPDEKAVLICRFVKSKQDELSNIIIGVVYPFERFSCISALVASLSAGLLSWNWFPVPPYTAKVCILCSLLHSLIGVGVATQQMLALSRAEIHPLFVDIIQRGVFGSPVSTSSSGAPAGTFWRSFVWQVPIMLLGNSIMFVIVALCIAVYAEAARARVWGAETITAMSFTISFCFGTFCYLVSWYQVESEMQAALQADEHLVQSVVDDQDDEPESHDASV